MKLKNVINYYDLWVIDPDEYQTTFSDFLDVKPIEVTLDSLATMMETLAMNHSYLLVVNNPDNLKKGDKGLLYYRYPKQIKQHVLSYYDKKQLERLSFALSQEKFSYDLPIDDDLLLLVIQTVYRRAVAMADSWKTAIIVPDELLSWFDLMGQAPLGDNQNKVQLMTESYIQRHKDDMHFIVEATNKRYLLLGLDPYQCKKVLQSIIFDTIKGGFITFQPTVISGEQLEV